MFDKIKRLLGKPTEPEQPDAPDVGSYNGYISYLPNLSKSTFGLANGSYDNTYPSISRIADAIAEVRPIAINARGEEVKNARLLDVLNRPNKQMCSTDFMEALAVMLLVHPKVYLLVWRKGENGEPVAGGEITEQNICGLTFMEGVSERLVGGKSEYGINGKVFTEREVISLSLAVNPYSLNDGYSPSVAAKKWATTDDYIAEYHNAQFRNNARPAGMITIVADSEDEFNDAVDTIEAKFRGARNAGNTIYNMRPSQTLDGKPAPAKIEWTPFTMTNKDLTLQPIYDQANRKMENVFGVPDEVRGHLQNSNYASAEVADYIFSRRVIYPMLVKIYAKLNHGLNIVTGGMGYALTFNYEVPMLTDTRKLQAEALKTMIDAGFSVDSSVEALRLPESYSCLKLAPPAEDSERKRTLADDFPSDAGSQGAQVPKAETATKKDKCADRPSASDSSEITRQRDVANSAVADAIGEPAQPTTDAMRPIKKTEEAKNEDTPNKADLVAPNLLTGYAGLMSHITNEMWSSTDLLLQAYTNNGTEGVEAALEDIQSQLLRTYEDDTDKDLKRDKQKIYDTLDHLRVGTIASAEKELGSQLGVEVNYAGTDIKERITEVVVDDLYDSYKTALINISNQVAEIIYKRADEVDEMGEDIAEEVASLANKQEWRAVRFGFTEQQVVMAITAQMLWEWAQKEYNFKGYKTWHISPLSPAPCEECIKTNGEQVRITEKFSNGAMYPPLHPNCYCYLTYSTERTGKQVGRAERSASDEADRRSPAERAASEGGKECLREAAGQANAQPTIKITCPKCGRFLMDTSEAKIQKMKCPNTKCKAWLSIDTIKDGATIVREMNNE